MSGTDDTALRQRVGDLVESLAPPPVPLEAIVQRGRALRLRRAGAVAGSLALAGIIAATALLIPRGGAGGTALPVTVPANGTAGPGGVFASGVAAGHRWRLAVQDIADPGYRCLPAITVNGTDADQVFPAAGSSAAVALGTADPGIGFAFVQVPAGVGAILIDGQERVPAVTATVCGQRYHLAGFAYRLASSPRVTMVSPSPGPSPAATVPVPAATSAFESSIQTAGMWTNLGTASSETFTGILASGKVVGQDWSIKLLFGLSEDCYEFSASFSSDGSNMGACGPVSTPGGVETIMALPLGMPEWAEGATGYAVQVSPATAHLRATMSGGHTQLVTPRVVGPRRYAAFVVPDPLRLVRLTWLDASGREIASTTALPRYGYTQFQP
ncbi:MAG: hypothetical protein WAK82_22285 [Streptosporangiaceae bacterium]